jgi:hypothetical protein
MNHLWWGKIPLEVISNYILIRDVRLNASGRFDKITLNLAAKLEIPHHVGAGGEEDFAEPLSEDDDVFHDFFLGLPKGGDCPPSAG